jgi:hypothetical protein
MPLPQAFITRYFQLINNRQFTEAKRELQRIKEKIAKTEWNHGYYRALLGMLLAQKHNGSQYTFLTGLNPTDKQALRQYKGEFQTQTQNRFHDDYDRGYFTAWQDYMRLLLRTADTLKPPQQNSITKAPSPQDPAEQASLTRYQRPNQDSE